MPWRDSREPLDKDPGYDPAARLLALKSDTSDWPVDLPEEALLRRAIVDALAFTAVRSMAGDTAATAALADEKHDGDVTRLQVLLRQAADWAVRHGSPGDVLTGLRLRVVAVALLRGDVDMAEAQLREEVELHPGRADLVALLRFVEARQRAKDAEVFADHSYRAAIKRRGAGVDEKTQGGPGGL